MNKFFISMLITALSFTITAQLNAQTPTPAPSDQSANILKILKSRMPPAMVIEKVQPSQWPWLYEVITNSEIFYIDPTGDFIFSGHVIDTKTLTDMTAKRWNEISGIDFNSLPLSLAIKHVRGDGSRKIAVFSDPHCPFCVKLENTLQEMTNITVYTFLYPVETLHPGATETAKNIWCAPNRAAAWSEWMLKKKKPAAVTNCKADEVNTLVQLGQKLKINGTPTIYFSDGHNVAAALTKEQLEAELKAIK